MPLSEFESKEALRKAADWLMVSDLPGSAAAREGIAGVIPLIMMGQIIPRDLDELASIVEDNARSMGASTEPPEQHLTELREAVTAAFKQLKQS